MEKTNDSGKKRPKPTANSKEARLKAALKANMGRRKAQARARAANTNEDKGS